MLASPILTTKQLNFAFHANFTTKHLCDTVLKSMLMSNQRLSGPKPENPTILYSSKVQENFIENLFKLIPFISDSDLLVRHHPLLKKGRCVRNEKFICVTLFEASGKE